MILSNVSCLSHGSEKRVDVKCDICGKTSSTRYANYYNSQKKRGWPKTTYCRSCVGKISAQKRKGKPAHNKGKKLSENQKGKNHPSWKGGKFISTDGYVMVYVGGDKKKIGWTSYRKEHIVIAEEMMNRPLEKNEVVHHIDGEKTNNEKSNLWVAASAAAHKNAHQSLQEIGYSLYVNGIIGFNKKLGLYYLRS